MGIYILISIIVILIACLIYLYNRYKEAKSSYNGVADRKNKLFSENYSLKKDIEVLEKENKNNQILVDYYKNKSKEQEEGFDKKIQDYCNLKRNELEEEYTRKCSKIKELIDSSSIASFSASMFADIETYACKFEVNWLENKPQPAYAAASEIKKKVNEKCRVYLQQYREMLYKYEYLMNSFPELKYYVDNIDSLKNITYDNLQQYGEEYDRTHNYLTKEEFEAKSPTERNQLALDRYVESHNKTDWEIGRDYELYCGYVFRSKDGITSVQQHGIENGLEDLGRDIIAKDSKHVYIIQCKYWSQHREIHEKHIAQLYGSAKEYEIKNNVPSGVTVVPVFITNTELSDMAKTFAEHLGVELRHWEMKEFPRIKCNVSANGEKIYHLPFDQQYDSTKIYGDKGDFYAMTVAEAERKHYRRAYRWNGN